MKMEDTNLSKIMNLVSDVSDKIPEGTYLDMCNTLKGVYNDIKQPKCPYTNEILQVVSLENGLKAVVTPILFETFQSIIGDYFNTLNEARARVSSTDDEVHRLRIELTKLKNEVKELKVADDKMKVADDEVKVADDEMKVADDEIIYKDRDGTFVQCRFCHSMLKEASMKRHLKSKKCQRARRAAIYIREIEL